MTTFPETVYRVPGLHRGFRTTFDYAPVNSADELAAMEKAGWHLSIWDAIAAAKKGDVIAEVTEAKAAVAAIDDVTREALEEEAKRLGIPFNARTRDKVLAERIAAAR